MRTGDELRRAGIAGVVLALVLVAAFALDFVIIGTTGGDPAFNLQHIGPDLVRASGSTVWRVEAWLYVLAIVPFAVFIVGLTRALRSDRDEGLPGVAQVTTLLSFIFSTVHNAAIVSVLQFLVPPYTPGSPEGAAIETTATALLGFGNTTFWPGGGVGGLLLVIGMWAIGKATLAGGQFPRWTAYTAYGAALLSLLGYLQYLVRGLLLLALLGWVLLIVWIVAVSTRLLRASQSAM